MDKRSNLARAFCAAAAAAWCAAPAAAQKVIDLTHPIPTYQPMAGDPMKPDMTKPWGDARLFPTFGQHAVLAMSKFPTNQGHFDLGTIVLSEHHGTHLDSAGHYVNDGKSQEAAGTPVSQRKLVHQLGGADLVGPIVFIDISGRVQRELDRNGGKPSPDKSVTDFSNGSRNVVGADDVAAVAGKIRNGAWLVIHTGWSKFFFEGGDFAKDPYVNGWNHPGMNKAAVDKLIEIMEKKKVVLSGIVADNIGIDSGQSALGDDDKWTNSWHAHVRLLQRGVKFVENAAHLDQLAAVRHKDRCLLSVGAPKHVRGTGGPSRVLAICR
jgi:kynurenine formamidase